MKTGDKLRLASAFAGMRRPLAVFLALVSMSTPGSRAQGDTPARERLTLPGLGRESLTVTDLKRGTTLLVVWASWSPRCRDVGAHIDRLDETWSAEARVASVVFQEDPESVREIVTRHGLKTPVYLDLSGDFSKQHAVTTLPMLLIFRDGELTFRGKLAANSDAVIERLLR